ncbi:MAG: hypothetical protein R3B70_43875 [Polyangiaceae bacterium]
MGSSVLLAIALASPRASATPGTTFGAGPRDESLVRSAVAEGDTTDAATENPAFAAAEGTHIRVGYGAAAPYLRVNGIDARVAPILGFDTATHTGRHLLPALWAGVGFALHLPGARVARISFRPATEPQFIFYEAEQQRLSFDLAAALRYGPISVGGGASVALGVGGPGVSIDVAQDAAGPRATGATDISLGYRLAPLAGVVAHFGRLQLGASFRGELAVDLSLQTVVKVALDGNPINGVTTVVVSGASGYEPPRVNLGARVLVLRGLRAFAALELSAYSAAPAPVADVSIDVDLSSKPALKEGRFVEPRFRDTLAPKVGVEWRYPSLPLPPTFFGETVRAADPWKVAVRAGYAFAPSPVPPQRGFTSYADSSRHTAAIGAAYHLGDVLGVDLSLSIAAQLHVLETRREQKSLLSLPFAEYQVNGEMIRGSLALEGQVK